MYLFWYFFFLLEQKTNFNITGMNLAHCSRQLKTCFKISLSPVKGVLCWASRWASSFADTGQRVGCNMVHWLWNHTVSQMDSWHAGPKSPQPIWHVCPTRPWHLSPSGSATMHRCPCIAQMNTADWGNVIIGKIGFYEAKTNILLLKYNRIITLLFLSLLKMHYYYYY